MLSDVVGATCKMEKMSTFKKAATLGCLLQENLFHEIEYGYLASLDYKRPTRGHR